MQSVWLRNVLDTRPKRWLPEDYSSYDALLAAALEAVVRDASSPARLADWKWGVVNNLEIQHPVLGRIPLLRRWTGTGIRPQSGSGYAVKAVTATHGPSERFTADLSDLDNSTLNLVTGESGNFLSPNYLDQWKAWYEGTTFALPFSKGMVERESRHRLVLTPAQ
jgi:penicillin amidase